MNRRIPFEESWVLDPHTGCWNWSRARSPKGYGRCSEGAAHRWSWERVHGPIPNGLHVLHKCDNPPCVNPDHLFLGTNADNMRDKFAKGRDVPPKRILGERNGSAKLTESDVPVIREMARSGLSSRKIGAHFGVSKTTIGDLLNGRYWAHVVNSGDSVGRTERNEFAQRPTR